MYKSQEWLNGKDRLEAFIWVRKYSANHWTIQKQIVAFIWESLQALQQPVDVWAVSPVNCSVFSYRTTNLKNPGDNWGKLTTDLAFRHAHRFLLVLENAWSFLTRKSWIHLFCSSKRECSFFSSRNDAWIRLVLVEKSRDFYHISAAWPPQI